MNLAGVKNFPVKQVVKDIVTFNSLTEKCFIYSCKIDLPKELEMPGNKVAFQELIFSLINQAKKAYSGLNHLTNKIILLTCKLENEKEISFTITDGGSGLSFFSKKMLQQSLLVLGDGSKESDIQKINNKIKKEFNGYLRVFSKINKGTTIKCFFPLNQ